MTIETSTAAQRQTLRDALYKAAHSSQRFAQDSVTPTVAQAAVFDPRVVAAQSAIAAAGYSAALPATQAVVADGGSVPVKNSAGTVTKTGTAAVAANAITGIALAATEAIVSNAGTVAVQNSAGTAVPGTSTATVAAGVVSNVKLAATNAVVTNAVKVNAVSVTGTGNFATFTVAAGVITAIVLSAS